MDINKLKKILERYHEGKANETETALVEAWYRSYGSEEQPLSGEEAAQLRESLNQNIRKATVTPKVVRLPFMRIAASLFIFSAIGFLAWRLTHKNVVKEQNYTTVVTGTNGLKELALSDGSVIWINAQSRVKIPANGFTGPQREIVLEEGEAFFDIKHDDAHPFIVHTAHINVQVLGTSFNVRAYKALRDISVSVVTGKVGVTGGNKTLAMLLPGQQLSYDVATATAQQKSINTGQAQSWKQGYTYLNQASFTELSTIIKNIYGLSLKAGNKKVAGYRFSLRLMHNLPPKQIISLVSQLHHTHFRKEGNDIVLY